MSADPVRPPDQGGAQLDPAMEAEFDVMAGWTLEAVTALGQDHAIPAGCRGSASPASLAWLGEACELARDSRLLDAGGGIGGPAAYARERYGVRAAVVDPMADACRAATALFGLPAVVALGERLPIRTGSVDTVWCLGVLCTVTDKPALLRELRRVLPVRGVLGLLVYVAVGPVESDAPRGNHFPTRAELERLVDEARFDIGESVEAQLSDVPRSWSGRADRVKGLIEQRHGTDPRFEQAQEQERRIGRLLADGRVAGVLVRATAR